MADTIWTQEDIDRLKAAISSGVQTVTYSGPPSRTVTYQSLKEMRDLLAEMRAEVAEAAGSRSNVRYAVTRNGFNR